MSSTRYSYTWAFDLAATGLLAGAIVHLAAWLEGPRWMAALGAPPPIVSSATAGSWPALLGTLVITTLLVGLALCSFVAARRTARSILLRGILGLFAIIFLARGLLVVPFVFLGQREWRTPVGKVIVTGDWFVTGSLVVLTIGTLIGLGLYQTRSRQRTFHLPDQERPERRPGLSHRDGTLGKQINPTA